MLSARIFVCHDLNLARDKRPETQVFRQLCLRLRKAGAEVVIYEGNVSEEAFFTFFSQELPTCQWFLLFQTPHIILVSAVRTAVNTAQTRFQQGQLQGVLRFLMLPDETREWTPEWSAIPAIGASHDYPQAIEKLILGISLHGKTTEKGDLIVPPLPLAANLPLLPPIESVQPPQSLTSQATVDDTTRSDVSVPQPKIVYNTTHSGIPAPQPASASSRLNPSDNRASERRTRTARKRVAHPARPGILLTAFILVFLLIILCGLVSPLRTFVTGPQIPQRQGLPAQKLATTTALAITGLTVTSTSSSTRGNAHVGTTPTGTGSTQKTPVPPHGTTPTPIPGTTPTLIPGATPTPMPTSGPTPTPTPQPVCPAQIQYGSTGTLVKTLQEELNARGIKGQDGNPLTVDGDFGTNTEFAVEAWQSKENIEVDGEVGPITWHSLGNC